MGLGIKETLSSLKSMQKSALNHSVKEARKGMRICFISSYPPNYARLSEYAHNLVNELAKSPTIDQITVLTDQIYNSKASLPENPKINVKRIWKQDQSLSVLSVLTQVTKIKPDAVTFNIGFQSFGKSRICNFTGLSMILLCRLHGFKVMVVLHNLAALVDLSKVRQRPSIINKTGIMLATRVVLSASTVVVMVKSYADYLQKKYNKPEVLFIPHGNFCHDCQLINSKEKVILMFGHMGPYKGLPVLLKAFEMITKERNDVKLIVAGADHPNFPGYIKECAKTAPQRVIFTGYAQEHDLCKVFGAADVVVTPYLLATGTSGVFHLACGFGKPIVSSNLPEIRELVAHGASAILVPPNNPNELKTALLKVIDNKSQASTMSKQNLRFAQKERMNIIAQVYEDIYLKLLKS